MYIYVYFLAGKFNKSLVNYELIFVFAKKRERLEFHQKLVKKSSQTCHVVQKVACAFDLP